MTESTRTMQEHPSDVVAARIGSFTARFVEITRERALLDAREARLLAEAAAYADATFTAVVSSSTPPAEGRALARRSLCASLAMATLTPEPTMQRAISDAEALVHDAPAALAALEQATIGRGHTRVITDQLRDIPADGRAMFLEHVLPVAEQSTPARLKQRARVLRERLHPESITARATRSLTDRRVEFEPAADGMAWLHLFTSADIARGIFERLSDAALEVRLGGDDRTLSQLRADALASIAVAGVVDDDQVTGAAIARDAERDDRSDPATSPEVVFLAGSAPSTITSLDPAFYGISLIERPIAVAARIRATVQVTVPVLSLLGVTEDPGTLDGYGPIDPDTAARLAITAPSMTRVLTHPETGAVLSVGRDQYRVPADLQRAVRLRDITCRAPGCGRRARTCDLDHSVAWQHGGTTAVDNLACLCRHHHRLKHLPGWSLDHGPGGVLTWHTPDGREHRTEPEPLTQAG